MNLRSGVRPQHVGVKVFCAKCSKEADEVIHERDQVLLRDRLVAKCHEALEVVPLHLDLPEGTEILAFGGA